MKAVILLVAIVGLIALLPLTTITGRLAQYPMPWPGIDALTLHGKITDITGRQLPPGKLTVFTSTGMQFGEGGSTLIDYTLTITYGWHEHLPFYVVTYFNYQDLTERLCITIDLREILTFPRPYSDSTIFYDLQCAFDLTKPGPIIIRPRQYTDNTVII